MASYLTANDRPGEGAGEFGNSGDRSVPLGVFLEGVEEAVEDTGGLLIHAGLFEGQVDGVAEGAVV